MTTEISAADPASVIEQQETARVRKVVEDWAVLRDAGDWDAFSRVWHPEGWMTATWFQGPYHEFIAVSREGFERGVQIAHFLGGFGAISAKPEPSPRRR